MSNYERDWAPYMGEMGMPNYMQPMMTMPESQLERMYPEIYYRIYPEIIRQCDNYEMNNGNMREPTQEEINRMVEDIVNRMENALKDNEIATDARQVSADSVETQRRRFTGRDFLRDLTSILLIRELLRRRNRPFIPYGYYGRGYWDYY